MATTFGSSINLLSQLSNEVNDIKILKKEMEVKTMVTTKPLTAEGAGEVLNKAAEFLNTGGEDAKKKLNKLLDFNKDGKVNKNDFIEFIKSVLMMSLGVYIVLFYLYKDDITFLIAGGDWVGLAQFIEDFIVIQGVILIIGFFKEKFKKVITEEDTKLEAEKAKNDELAIQLEKEKAIQKQKEAQYAFDLLKAEYKVIDSEMSAECKAAIARVLMTQLDAAESAKL